MKADLIVSAWALVPPALFALASKLGPWVVLWAVLSVLGAWFFHRLVQLNRKHFKP